MASQFEAFWFTIHQTSVTLSIDPSKALILLLRYNWDVRSLVGDYNSLVKLRPILDQCPQVLPANKSTEHCACCHVNVLCEHFNCGHFICENCSSGSVADQLSRGSSLICPAPDCDQFIYYHTLPDDLSERYLRSALEDYIEKTVDKRSPFAKCLDMVGSQKKKIACIAAAAVVGFNVYKAKCWVEKHPIKARILRFFVSKFFWPH